MGVTTDHATTSAATPNGEQAWVIHDLPRRVARAQQATRSRRRRRGARRVRQAAERRPSTDATSAPGSPACSSACSPSTSAPPRRLRSRPSSARRSALPVSPPGSASGVVFPVSVSGAAVDAAEASIAAARSAVSSRLRQVRRGHRRTRQRARSWPDPRLLPADRRHAHGRGRGHRGARRVGRPTPASASPASSCPRIERAGLNAFVVPPHARRWPDSSGDVPQRVAEPAPCRQLRLRLDPGVRAAQDGHRISPSKHGVPLELISLELSERQSFDLSPATLGELTDVAEAGVRAGARRLRRRVRQPRDADLVADQAASSSIAVSPVR